MKLPAMRRTRRWLPRRAGRSADLCAYAHVLLRNVEPEQCREWRDALKAWENEWLGRSVR